MIATSLRAVRATLDRGSLALLAILLVLRLLVLLGGPGILTGDGFLYVGAAQHMAATGAAPTPTYQPRGFSVALAPIVVLTGMTDAAVAPDAPVVGGALPTVVHVLQVLLDLGVVLLLGTTFLAFAPRRRWAMRAGLAVVALQPITASFSNLIQPEGIATIAFFSATVLLARTARERLALGRVAGAAFLLGLAGLMRFDLLPLGACLLVLWLIVSALRPSRGWLALGVPLAALLFAAAPVAMMGYHYASRGDPRYFVYEGGDNPAATMPGYCAWIRGWAITPAEISATAIYTKPAAGWQGFDPISFPARAFSSPEQRTMIERAVAGWKISGYSPAVDHEFADAARMLAAAKPLQRWLIAPGARTAELWINPSGGNAINFTFDLQPPKTWAVGGVTFAFKISLIVLALFGAGSVTRSVWRAPQRIVAALTWPASIVWLSAAAVLGRAAEMWLLNASPAGAALIEARYVVTLWPSLIVVALYGWCAVADRFSDRKLAA